MEENRMKEEGRVEEGEEGDDDTCPDRRLPELTGLVVGHHRRHCHHHRHPPPPRLCRLCLLCRRRLLPLTTQQQRFILPGQSSTLSSSHFLPGALGLISSAPSTPTPHSSPSHPVRSYYLPSHSPDALSLLTRLAQLRSDELIL